MKPYAIAIGKNPGFENIPEMMLYNVCGNSPLCGSTVTETTLWEHNIPIGNPSKIMGGLVEGFVDWYILWEGK